MSTSDHQIADILEKYGEPVAGSIWRVQGQAVIYHKALERIAAHAKITFDPPNILRAEADEAVILVTGRIGDRAEWSIGEARISVNYRVSARQPAYPYAMAEKRAKDRVILKLIGLHGMIYSEEEADDFRDEIKRQRAQERLATRQARGEPAQQRQPEPPPHDPKTGEVIDFPGNADLDAETVARDIRQRIDRAKTINAVTDLMLQPDVQKDLNEMRQEARDQVRDYAKARLFALGWPAKKGA